MANDDGFDEFLMVIVGFLILVAAVAIVVFVILPLIGITLSGGVVAGGLEGAGRWFGHLWRECTRPLTMASPPASASDETLS